MYSFIFYFKFWLFMLLSMPMIIPLWILHMFRMQEAEKKFILWATTHWARFCLRITPAEVTVHGMENLPEGGNLVFAANHQGAYDIPLLMAVIPRNFGFISKKELYWLPLVSTWMRAMKCVFIDRKSPRNAMKSLDLAVENLKDGHSMVVFPEGTRSRSNNVGEFHRGSFKIAFRAESTIVPITIKDTFRLREEHNRITPGAVELFIHPPVATAGLSSEELREAVSKIVEQISAPLKAGTARDQGSAEGVSAE